MTQETFFVELTDTYGGEANYSFVHRFLVKASSSRGAIRKAAKETGYSGRVRLSYDCGDHTRHNVANACLCFFTSYVAPEEVDHMKAQYFRVKEL